MRKVVNFGSCWDKEVECEMPSSCQATWWGYIKSKNSISCFLSFSFSPSLFLMEQPACQHSSVVEQHCHLVVLWDSTPPPPFRCREKRLAIKSCCIIHALFNLKIYISSYRQAIFYIFSQSDLFLRKLASISRYVFFIAQECAVNFLDCSEFACKPAGQISLFLLSATCKANKLCSLECWLQNQVCSVQHSMFVGHICLAWLCFRKLFLSNNDSIRFCYIIASCSSLLLFSSQYFNAQTIWHC